MTREELAFLLAKLDLQGRQVVVHSSLSSFGTVDGGAETLCRALMDVVGERGTILMPAFTAAETLPAGPRTSSMSFHPELPVSRDIGVVAETFRRIGSVMRSNHPTHSFSAWGHNARGVLSTQRDNNVLGPLKKLNVVQGDVVLLGVPLRAATAIHLAEEQCRVPYLSRRTAVRINSAGYDERVVIENVPGCGVGFDVLEARLDPAKITAATLVHGTARRIPIRYLVNLAAAALRDDPAVFVCPREFCSDCAEKRRLLALAGQDARAGGGTR